MRIEKCLVIIATRQPTVSLVRALQWDDGFDPICLCAEVREKGEKRENVKNRQLL